MLVLDGARVLRDLAKARHKAGVLTSLHRTWPMLMNRDLAPCEQLLWNRTDQAVKHRACIWNSESLGRMTRVERCVTESRCGTLQSTNIAEAIFSSRASGPTHCVDFHIYVLYDHEQQASV